MIGRHHDGTAIWLSAWRIVVEKCLAGPGLGRLLVDSVDMRDYRIDSGGKCCCFSGIYSYQLSGGCPLCRH